MKHESYEIYPDMEIEIQCPDNRRWYLRWTPAQGLMILPEDAFEVARLEPKFKVGDIVVTTECITPLPFANVSIYPGTKGEVKVVDGSEMYVDFKLSNSFTCRVLTSTDGIEVELVKEES